MFAYRPAVPDSAMIVQPHLRRDVTQDRGQLSGIDFPAVDTLGALHESLIARARPVTQHISAESDSGSIDAQRNLVGQEARERQQATSRTGAKCRYATPRTCRA